jgi:hypothetical protein
MRSHLKKRKKG